MQIYRAILAARTRAPSYECQRADTVSTESPVQCRDHGRCRKVTNQATGAGILTDGSSQITRPVPSNFPLIHAA